MHYKKLLAYYVHDWGMASLLRVPGSMPLYDILNEFQKGHSHMAVVVRERNDKEHSAADRQNEGKS